MLELFKAILGTLSKVLDPATLFKLAKESRRDQLGAHLFMLCVVIDDICTDGELIVQGVESYVSTMSRYLHSDRDRWALAGLTTNDALGRAVRSQIENLARLEDVVREFDAELHLVDAVSQRQLKLLVAGHTYVGKTQALRHFNLALDAGGAEGFPFAGPTAAEIAAASAALAGDPVVTAALDRGGFPRDDELEPAVRAEVQAIQDGYRNAAVRWTGLWDARVHATLERYLQTHEPRRLLAELQDVSVQLRANLEKVFPIADILWLVGTRKFRSRYGRTVFKA